MGITGGFGTLIDFVTGRPRRWYMRADGIRRWVSNDQPCDTANDADLWRCTVCGRTGTVGRCCGEETREPVRASNASSTRRAPELSPAFPLGDCRFLISGLGFRPLLAAYLRLHQPIRKYSPGSAFAGAARRIDNTSLALQNIRIRTL